MSLLCHYLFIGIGRVKNIAKYTEDGIVIASGAGL
jgi:hypothetical protein